MKVLIAVGAIVIFIYGMLASLLGTIVPGLGTSLGLSTLELSYLALAQGLGLAVTSVWAGAFMDHWGKKPGILAGLAASMAGLALLSHALGLVTAIAAMAMLGVGGSLVIVGANALVNDVSETNRAPALNILNLFVGLGGMATPLVAGNLLHSDASLTAYFGLAIAFVAMAAALLAPIPGAARSEAVVGVPIAGGVFGDATLYILSSITFLYTACEFAMWNWLPKFLIASGVPQVTALNILSLGFACGMLLGRFVAAFLGRLSPVMVILFCAAAMGMTTLATLLAGSTATVAGLVFATGLAMAPVFPTTIAIVGRIFAQRSGTAIGFAITCGFSGLVVSSPLIGMLAGADPQGIGRALLIMPVFSGLIVLILVLFRQRLAAQPDDAPAPNFA